MIYISKKIYIIGGLGSGKSYFAKKLSQKTGIDYFGVDPIVFKEGFFEERTEEDRDYNFQNIVKKERWILEGTFTENWISTGLASSTQIIYLATPPLVRLWRFIRRVGWRGINKQNDLIDRTKLVLGFKHKEWDRTANKYEELLKPYKNKVTILKSSKEVTKYLDSL